MFSTAMCAPINRCSIGSKFATAALTSSGRSCITCLRLNASIATKCMLQIPTPMVKALPSSHNTRVTPEATVMRPASCNAA
jgi:hypothetical protein